MKRISLCIIVCFFFASCMGRKSSKVYPVIPFPSSVKEGKGFFILSAKTGIYDEKNFFREEIKNINEFLQAQYGFTLKESGATAHADSIVLKLKEANAEGDESYVMKIHAKKIEITGSQAGVFYALQSLKQILQGEGGLKIACGEIHDAQRFTWRGMHLDVCRHFFSTEEVKKYLDLLALCKFNVFHWHLTDDQGWRIEIKKYPLLTLIGSLRKETIIGKQSDTAQYDGKPYGGFYTQEEIKEIVAYAAARHITVVPEIEMPGHSLAALAAYPQFSCRQQPLEVGMRWGVYDDVYCAGNDSTFQFLGNVLSEVCMLFPGKYIHIGGDECVKERWKECTKCRARIKNENLVDENALQSYFISRMEKFLNSKGKQIIGWDEILEGGLAPNAAVMSWRGTDGGIEAAKQKHFVVMSPSKPCYFDHYQSEDKAHEPLAIGGYNPLENVYAYEPVPQQLASDEKKYIMGAQGNVWTEYITDFRQVEYMAVPRMFALSETLWSDAKFYKDFIYRLKKQAKLLDKMKINYAKHFLK
jgi:hexosaminidase